MEIKIDKYKLELNREELEHIVLALRESHIQYVKNDFLVKSKKDYLQDRELMGMENMIKSLFSVLGDHGLFEAMINEIDEILENKPKINED